MKNPLFLTFFLYIASFSTVAQSSSVGDQKFVFFTYSLSSSFEVEYPRASLINDLDLKKSFGLKGQYFKALNMGGSAAPLIGLGGSFGLKAKLEGENYSYSNSAVSPLALHALFGVGVDLRGSGVFLPYIGLGAGNIGYKGRRGDSLSKMGLSYELGATFRYNRLSVGLAHQIIKGDTDYSSIPPENRAFGGDAKQELTSTMLNLGIAF